MGFGTNPAFRSRSLVRSRIGAFRASDAGSNPAGSILTLGRNSGSSLVFHALPFGRFGEESLVRPQHAVGLSRRNETLPEVCVRGPERFWSIPGALPALVEAAWTRLGRRLRKDSPRTRLSPAHLPRRDAWK